MTAQVSVVIACYDANDTLGLQLEALAHQEGAPAFEVLVVDNNSPEAPDAVVNGWSDVLDIRVVRASEHQGVAYARNVGVSRSAADRIIFCDADDCAGPRFVQAAASALEAAPFVTGGVHTVNGRSFISGRPAVWKELSRLSATPGPRDVVRDAYPVFMGGASAVERAAFMEVGGFDQGYVPGAEDNDLGLRVLAQGFTLLRVPDMTLAERPRANATGAFRRSFDGGRMHMRLCAGHDLWSVSPHLHDPEWWRDLLRLPGALVTTAIRDRSASGRRGLASRAGLRLGQFVGFVEYRIVGRPVGQDRGLGLTDAPTSQ